ncbi:MAG: hypothetical protein AB7G15_06100 [Alphaproteobacteria bacterium]
MAQQVYTFGGTAWRRAWWASALVAACLSTAALAQESPRRQLGPPIKLEPLEPGQQPDQVNPTRPDTSLPPPTPRLADPANPGAPPGKIDESVRIEELPPIQAVPETARPAQPPPPRAEPPVAAQPQPQPRSEPPPAAQQPALRPAPDAAPADPSLAGIGTLEPGKGGLPADLWRGVGRDRVLGLFGKLPARSNSLAVRQLTRRLLLTSAPPPQGLLAADNFLSLRAERLYAMGALEDLRALLAKAKPGGRDDVRAKVEVEGLLLLGERQAACAAVDLHMKAGVTVFLEQARAACYALTAQTDKALLAMGLLRERNVREADEAFAVLIDAQQEASTATLTALPNPTALHIALLTRSKQPLPATLDKLNAAASIRAVALARNEPAALRLELAERAAAIGALPPARLAELYAAQKLTEAQLKSLALTLPAYDASARAAYYQRLAASKDIGERLGHLATWWRLARAKGDAVMVARVTAPLLKDVPADARHAPVAADVARTLYLAGDPLAATVWFRVMQKAAFRNVEQYTQLAPVAKLAAGDSIKWSPDDLDAWVALQTGKLGERAHDRVRLLYVLMAAVGDGKIADPALRAAWARHVPPEVAASLTTTPRDWRNLQQAADAGRVGETLLVVLGGIGDERPDRLDPAVLHLAIVALRRLGLKDEARQLATEAALSAGL